MDVVSLETPKESAGTLRLVLLFVNGLLPVGVIAYLSVLNDHLLVSMLVLHFLVMTTIPVIILQGKLTPYYRMLQTDLRTAGPYIVKAVFASLAIVGLGFALFVPFTCKSGVSKYCFDFTPFTAILGPNLSKPMLISAGLYFTVVNPLIEEWFWRVFLHKELGLTYLTQELLIPDSLPSYGTVPLLPSPATYSSFTSKLVITSMYASYHVLLLSTRISLAFGMLALVFVTSLGLLLIFARERLGIPACVCLHASVDCAVVVSLYYEKFG